MVSIRGRVLVGVLFLVSLVAGCGTAASITDGDPGIYSGMRRDFQVVLQGTHDPDAEQASLIGRALAFFDLPFSGIFDTAILPLLLAHTVDLHLVPENYKRD